MPWLVTGAFTYSIVIDENSYAVNEFNEGMSVEITGSAICSTLVSSEIRSNE